MEIPDKYPDLLTVKDVAEFLRVDRSYVYRLIRAERLIALRLSPNKTRITKADLHAFIAESSTKKKARQVTPE